MYTTSTFSRAKKMLNSLLFRKTKDLIAVFLVGILSIVGNQSIAQNGLLGSGFGANNWSTISNFGTGAGGTRIFTTTANGTGFQYFRLVTNWSSNNNQWGPGAANDFQLLNGVPVPNTFIIENSTAKAYFIDVASTSDNYVFKTRGGGNPPAAPRNLVAFRIQGAVQSISTVTPSLSNVYPGQEVTITANLSANFSSGQSAYLRYSTNNFATSTIVEMSGSGTTRTTLIPSADNAPNNTVRYYIFTSGSGLNIAHADADFFTINLNNNGGSNFSYTVAANYTTASNGNWANAATWVANVVPVNNQPIVINHDVSLNSNIGTTGNITINAGKLLNLGNYTLTLAGGTTLTNNGTFESGTGKVVFNGSATVSGTLVFNNVDIFGGVNFGANSNLKGVLTLKPGSFINTFAPIYDSLSTLRYEIAGDYGRGNEWILQRIPYHVQIAGTTSLRLGANGGNNVEREVRGNLTIESGAALRLDDPAQPNPVLNNPATWGSNMVQSVLVRGNVNIVGQLVLSHLFGGDIKLEGNWTRSVGSTFTPNKRAVFFEGNLVQTVNYGDGTLTELFDYILINKSGGTTRLNTNLTCDATALNAFEINGDGDLLDLNGKTLAFTGDGGTFVSNGDNTIISSSGTGILLVNGDKSLNTDTLVSQTPLRIGENVDFQINTGREFNLSTRSLIINGNISGAGVLVAGATSNLIIGGTGNFSALNVKEVNGEKALGGLTINRIGLVTIGDIDLKGNLFVNAGAAISNAGNPMRMNNDTMPQFISGGGTIAHLVIDKDSTNIIMAGDLTISDTLLLINGDIEIVDNLLGLNGVFIPGSNNLVATSQSSLSIGGSGPNFILPNNIFSSGAELNNLTINRANGLTWNNQSPIINGNLAILNGYFYWGAQTLTLAGTASGSGFLRGINTGTLAIEGSGNFGGIQFENGYRELAEVSINRTSGVIDLTTNLTVDVINMYNGILDIGNNTITLLDALTEKSNSYVAGRVEKTMSISGSSNINTNNAFQINPNGNNLGVTTIAIISGSLAVVNVNSNEGIARQFEISPTTQPLSNVDIILSWPSALDNGKNVGIAIAYRSADGNTPWTPLNTSPINATGLNGIRSLGLPVSGFSTLTVTDENAPLPVSWLTFNGSKKDNRVLLNWETASELNNNYFEVLHSSNGSDFEVIGKVIGSGTVNSLNQYSFLHNSPNAGNNYYKLRQFDFDGKYSESRKIKIDFEQKNWQVYPNPTKDLLIVSGLENVAQITVFDVQGKLILNKVLLSNTQTVDLSGLKEGFYQVLVKDKLGNQQVFKVIKQ